MMKSITNKTFFAIFLLLQIFVNAQFSKEKPQIFIQKSDDGDIHWLFKQTDSMKFAKPDYNDKDWGKFKITFDKKSKSDKPYWLRSYIAIDSSLVNHPLQINVKQLGASEVFLDGNKISTIGKFNNGKVEKYALRTMQPIMFSLGDTKPHVLAVRYIPLPLSKLNKIINASTSFFVADIEPANEYINERIELDGDFHQYTMLISGFFLALSFIHFLLFAFYRKALYNLYFAFYNLAISFLSYLVLVFYKMEDPMELSKTVFAFLVGLAVFSISLSGFVNELFAKRKLRFKVLLALEIVSLILYYFSEKASFILIFVLLFYVIIESLVIIIRAMFRREKSAFIVGGGILTFLAYVIIVILSSISNFGVAGYYLDKGLLSVLVMISFPLSISAYLGWQYANTNLDLRKQLNEVNRLSEINLQQEQEKQHILQNQNDLLEKQVDERTQELQIEKQKTEKLLLNILPEEVAEELKEKGSSEAKYYDEVSVLFTDFVNFTQNSEKMGAEKMLKELNDCFTAFDLIMEKHGLEKIKTIGDAYMAVCGLPNPHPNHAYRTVLAALDIIDFIENRKKENEETLDIRIGVNSGALIAGIVGVKKFAYDIWGDTVNTAARMEQSSEKGKINISDSTYQLVKEQIVCEYRGKIYTKGKGEIDMYFAMISNEI